MSFGSVLAAIFGKVLRGMSKQLDSFLGFKSDGASFSVASSLGNFGGSTSSETVTICCRANELLDPELESLLQKSFDFFYYSGVVT